MKRVFVSLLLALWLEFFYKFGATHDISNFLGSIPIYFIYLVLLNIIVTESQLSNKLPLCLFMYGIISLLAEWFIIGNSPWSNPDAFQVGMFVFHATYPTLGIILSSNIKYAQIKKICLSTFIPFTIILPIGFIIQNEELRFAWFIWLPLVPYFICFSIITINETKKKFQCR